MMSVQLLKKIKKGAVGLTFITQLSYNIMIFKIKPNLPQDRDGKLRVHQGWIAGLPGKGSPVFFCL